MKTLCMGWLLCIALFSYAQQAKSLLVEEVFEYPELDFSGDWYSTVNDAENSYVLHIEKSAAGYNGSYCFSIEGGLKKDCSENQNLRILSQRYYIEVVLFSQFGGIVEGRIDAIGEKEIQWTSLMKMGESITPNTMEFHREGPSMYFIKDDYRVKLPVKGGKILPHKMFPVEETEIILKNVPEEATVYLSEIRDNAPNNRIYVITENNAKGLITQWLLTVNREGKEVDKLKVYEENEESGLLKNQQLIDFEINTDLQIFLITKHFKNKKLKEENKVEYLIDDRGYFKVKQPS